MDDQKRQDYLSSGWNSYPSFSKTALANIDHFCGRISKIEGSEVVVRWGDQTAKFESTRAQWIPFGDSKSEPSPLEVLSVGDLVSVKNISGGEIEVQLLAPARCDPISLHVSIDLARTWANFLESVRRFFKEREFLEVRTPTLVMSPGLEPFLESFKTELVLGRDRREFFLPTSPEFHLKKLLARGHSRVFEFKESFRNGEISETHQPEFLMLEWYRAFDDLSAIEVDVRELLCHLRTQFCSDGLWGTIRGDQLESSRTIKVTTVRELFQVHCDFQLRPSTTAEDLRHLCSQIQVEISLDSTDDFDDLFFRIFLAKIEPNLDRYLPTLVKDYPPSLAALSRLTKEGWADRFELYWKGIELANAYHELNDPVEQRRRFVRDTERRISLKRSPVPWDAEFLQALDSGLPPSGGIALGLDRLFMALFDIADIRMTREFPVKA